METRIVLAGVLSMTLATAVIGSVAPSIAGVAALSSVCRGQSLIDNVAWQERRGASGGRVGSARIGRSGLGGSMVATPGAAAMDIAEAAQLRRALPVSRPALSSAVRSPGRHTLATDINRPIQDMDINRQVRIGRTTRIRTLNRRRLMRTVAR